MLNSFSKTYGGQPVASDADVAAGVGRSVVLRSACWPAGKSLALFSRETADISGRIAPSQWARPIGFDSGIVGQN